MEVKKNIDKEAFYSSVIPLRIAKLRDMAEKKRQEKGLGFHLDIWCDKLQGRCPGGICGGGNPKCCTHGILFAAYGKSQSPYGPLDLGEGSTSPEVYA